MPSSAAGAVAVAVAVTPAASPQPPRLLAGAIRRSSRRGSRSPALSGREQLRKRLPARQGGGEEQRVFYDAAAHRLSLQPAGGESDQVDPRGPPVVAGDARRALHL